MQRIRLYMLKSILEKSEKNLNCTNGGPYKQKNLLYFNHNPNQIDADKNKASFMTLYLPPTLPTSQMCLHCSRKGEEKTQLLSSPQCPRKHLLQHPGVLSGFLCSFVGRLPAHLPLCLTHLYWR